MIKNCVDDIDIWIPWDCSWAWYDNTFHLFFISGTLLWFCKQHRIHFLASENSPVEDSSRICSATKWRYLLFSRRPKFPKNCSCWKAAWWWCLPRGHVFAQPYHRQFPNFQKMRETFLHRQKLVNDPGRSVDIFSSFPRFLDTKGLVSLRWDVLDWLEFWKYFL